MAVFKATKNKSGGSGTFKATERKSYDSTMVYDWETKAKNASTTLNLFGEKINSGGFLTADDLSSYRKAMDDYIDFSTRLRQLSTSFGGNSSEDDEEQWTTTVSSLEKNFAEISDYFSKWKTEDDFKAALSAQKEFDKMSTFNLVAGQKEIDDLEALRKEYDQLILRQSTANPESEANIRLREIRSQYGSKDDIDALISEKTAYLNQAKRLQEGDALSGVADRESDMYDPDFESKSGYVSTESDSWWDKLTSQYGMGYEDLTYEYINNQNGIRDKIKQKYRSYSSDGSSDGESIFEENGYDYMTENEIAIYNYYYAKDGKKVAVKYLDSIQETLNQRKATGMYKNMEGNTLLELAFSVAAGLDQFESGIKNMINAEADYIPVTSTQMASGMVREDLADKSIPIWYNVKTGQWEDKVLGNSLGQIGYDAITTTANMAPSILTSMAIGVLNPVAGEIAGTALMGASATGNAYQEALNLGYDKGQARAYSTLVGASEAGLQYLLGGIGKLGGKLSGDALTKVLNGVDNAFARTALKLGGNMLSEGLEEGLQEILTPWFKNLTLHTDEDVNWSEVAYSSLLGALTAGFIEGTSTSSGEVKTYKTGKQLKAADISATRLAEIGKTFSADTVAYQLAGRVDENTGAYTIGRLFNEIGATLTEQNVTEITNALVGKGMDTSTARKNAEALALVVEGGQLSKRQIAVIEANDVLAEVARTTLIDANTTWNQRVKGYNEMLKTLADEMTAPKASRTKTAQQSEANATTADTVDTQNKNAPESSYEAVAEGQMIRKDTGETVRIKEVAPLNGGKMTLRLEDGSEVDSSEVAYSNPGEAYVYETVANLGVDAVEATRLINAFRNSGVEGKAFADGMKLAFEYGYGNFSQQELAQKDFAGNIPRMYINTAYEIGQKMRQQEGNPTAQNGVEHALRTQKSTAIDSAKSNSDAVDLSNDNELSERVAGLFGAEKYKAIQQYILEVLGDQPITLKDGKQAVVDRSDALHIANKAASKKTAQISKIKELVENADLYAEDKNVEHNKFNYFCYYRADVKYGEDQFPVYLNVGRGKSDGKYHIYDITNKIRDTADRINGLERPKPNEGYALTSGISKTSIRNPGETVNKKVSGKAGGVYYTTKDGKVLSMSQAEKNGKLALKDKQSVAVKTAKFLQKLGLGGNYYFFESYVDQNGHRVFKDRFGNIQSAPNGLYYSDGDIYIDINAGTDSHSITLRTLSHELTHMIQQWSAAKYKVMADFLAEQYGKEGRNAYEAAKAKQAELSELRGKPVSFQEAYHEFVADSMSTLFDDGNLYEILTDLKKKDKTLVDYIKKFFDGLAAKVRKLYVNTQAETDEGQFVQGLSKDTVYRLQQLFADALADASENYATSEQKSTDAEIGVQHSSKAQKAQANKVITSTMSDAERSTILRSKQLVAPIYEGQADTLIKEEKPNLESGQDKLIKAALVRIGEEFEVFTDYDIKDVDVKITLSRGNLRESVSKKATPTQIAKLLPVLKNAVEKSVGVESHKNRYFYDNTTISFDNLIGGYVDGEYFVPVRFGLKHIRGGEVTLYVVIDQQKIKAEVLKPITQTSGSTGSRSAYNINIAQIIPFVNSKDLLRYLPDDMLTSAQKATKWEGISETIIYTNNKNDAKYKKFIDEGNVQAAKMMVDAAAKVAGYTIKAYHGTTNRQEKSTWNPTTRTWDTEYQRITVFKKQYPEQVGHFFNSDMDNAGGYGSDLYPVYLMLKKPLVIDCNGQNYASIAYDGKEMDTYEWAAYAKKQRYDGVIFENISDGVGYDDLSKLTTDYVVFDSNRIKSAETVVYDNNDNVIPISQRFNPQSNDIRYQDRAATPSNRELLAQALESVAANVEDYHSVKEYRRIAPLLDAEEAKLSRINAQIREMTFGNGERDSKKLVDLRVEAKQTQNRIDIYDKQLLRLEATAPLQKVLEREKAKAYKRAEQKGKEAVRKEKERAQAKYDELAAKNTAARKKASENRQKTELRKKIRKVIRDLDKILNRGDKKRNVKEGMKDFVAEALASAEVLFTDNYTNEDMIRNGVGVVVSPEEQKYLDEARTILAKINDLPSGSYEAMLTRQEAEGKLKNQLAYRMTKLKDVFTRERIRLSEAEVASVLGNLADEYAKLKDSNQEYVKGAFSENVYNYIKFLQGDIGGAKIKDMSLSQLESLYKAYTMVMTTVRNANKAFVASKNVDQLVEKLVTEFGGRKMPKKKVGAIVRNISNMTGWDYEKLYYALDRIGSDTLTELFTNLANSENIVMADVNDAKQEQLRIIEKYKYNTWKVDQKIDKDFVDNTGKTFRLTLGELMSLYAYSRREGAWNHIEYGGFVFGKSALTDVDPVTAYKLTKEQCEAITNTLTEEQKKFAEEMQTYLSDVMGAKGNEVSMLLYGIEMFGEKNYFPIHISGRFKANVQESQAKAEAGFSSMTNAGFTQAQDKKAKAPFVMESFMEVWSDHVNEMSRYHGTVPALEDIRKVMNYSYYSDSLQDSMAVKAIMENKFGKQAVDYFNNLYQEANSGAITDKLQKNSHKLLSLFRKGSVAYSLSVLIQQPASMVRAFALIPKKYFRGLRGHGALPIGIVQAATSKWTKAYKRTYAEMLKYAPGVTLAKEIGGFDTASGHSIRSYLLDTEKGVKQKWATGTALGKAKTFYDLVDDNPIANLPNVADKIAWIEIWNACKNETVATHKDLAPNSDAFMEQVGKRFTEVIRATQVYDSIFAKSPMLKSKNLAVQYLVSFMNEPNTTANMVESAARDFTRGDVKSGFSKATAVVRAIVFTGVLKSIIYAMRDDDEDETYIEKYIEALVNSLISDITVFNYIPIARDVWSMAQGYDVERPDMAIVSDAISSFTNVVKNIGKDTSDMTEEELEEWDKKVTEANWKLADSVCAFFGIPMKNVRREIDAVIDHARIAHENSGKFTWSGIADAVNQAIADASPTFAKTDAESNTDKLYDAIISGDTDYVNRLKGGYKDQSAINTAIRKALRENDQRIKEAARAVVAGRASERAKIAKEIEAEGNFSLHDIQAAINAEIDKIRKEAKGN